MEAITTSAKQVDESMMLLMKTIDKNNAEHIAQLRALIHAMLNVTFEDRSHDDIIQGIM